MRNKILPSVLLALILLYGGALRFTGQNWDDFSHSHPDERFLTALLLPQIGGSNSFTADPHNFPDQEILRAGDNFDLHSREDLVNHPNAGLGVIRDEFAVEAATWLMDEQRLFTFDDHEQAEVALISGKIDAIMVGKSQVAFYPESVTSIDSLRSEELQSLRCNNRYPDNRGIGGFFDTSCSPLNPHNAGHGFYVYGTFPLFLAHYGSEFVQSATANGLPLFDFQGGHLVWRGISAIFDLLAIVAVFALGRRIHGTWVGLFAALFYAAAPLAIQKAHFGTVNAIASFLVTVALYFAFAAQQRGKYRYYLLFGVFTGAAVASRINLAPLAGIIVIAAFVQAAPIFDPNLSSSERVRIFTRNLLGLVLSGLGAFLAFRILNPYAFAGPGFFGLLPNDRWIKNLESISAGVSGAQDYPPSWQWLARSSLIYTQKDMIFWAMGLGFGVLGWFGWLWSAYRLLRNRKVGLRRSGPCNLGRRVLPIHEPSGCPNHALLSAALQYISRHGGLVPCRLVSSRQVTWAQPSKYYYSNGNHWRLFVCGRRLSSSQWYDRRYHSHRARHRRFPHSYCDHSSSQQMAPNDFRRFCRIVFTWLGLDVLEHLSSSDHSRPVSTLHF